ncbi:MAG TPA: HEPN domain-containing protein [Methanofastidiosum sp.]|nr:HEPN domain-containing protein [Methanofastidiosum sp.]
MSNAYIHKADDSLESIQVNIKKEWKIATAYYTIYFSLYAILMRIGIKSEIHSCTVDFVKEYLNEYFNKEEIELIEDSLKARIDVQYFVDKDIPDELYSKLIESAPHILIKSKSILSKLTEKKIKSIRDEIKILITE